jgi:hypothetical protein
LLDPDECDLQVTLYCRLLSRGRDPEPRFPGDQMVMVVLLQVDL